MYRHARDTVPFYFKKQRTTTSIPKMKDLSNVLVDNMEVSDSLLTTLRLSKLLTPQDIYQLKNPRLTGCEIAHTVLYVWLPKRTTEELRTLARCLQFLGQTAAVAQIDNFMGWAKTTAQPLPDLQNNPTQWAKEVSNVCLTPYDTVTLHFNRKNLAECRRHSIQHMESMRPPKISLEDGTIFQWLLRSGQMTAEDVAVLTHAEIKPHARLSLFYHHWLFYRSFPEMRTFLRLLRGCGQGLAATHVEKHLKIKAATWPSEVSRRQSVANRKNKLGNHYVYAQ